MPTRTQTYSFDRDAPFFAEQGATETLVAGLRHGILGDLQEPTSGTVTAKDPDSNAVVNAAAVTVTGSQATRSVTWSSTAPIGQGWVTYWTFTWADGTSQTVRHSLVMCRYVPPNVVSAADLYKRVPELEYRIPEAQRATADGGDNSGWQPQIDQAYWAFLNWMLDDGRKPWEVLEVTGYKDYVATLAVMNAIDTLAFGPGESWAQKQRDMAHRLDRARARMRLRYDSEPTTTRKSAMPYTRLAPAGRPLA